MTKQHDVLLALLQKGLRQMELDLSSLQQQQLLDYILLVHQWNKVHNLTAIRNLEDMVVKHLLDSLAIAPYIQGDYLLDVGSGAGLPGIPLAICYPQKQMHLLDSLGKRITFLNQVVLKLQLTQVKTIHSRVEAYQSAQQYDTILARAFGSLATIWHNSQHLLKQTGQLLAMKGTYPQEELAELPKEVVVTSYSLSVPLLDSTRHILRLQYQGE